MVCNNLWISIHALREEGDEVECGSKTPEEYFYPRPPRGGRQFPRRTRKPPPEFLSTPSARRATHQHRTGGQQLWISIHALREEGDVRAVLCCQCNMNFYPRPPRGGRPSSRKLTRRFPNFYPRPPRGGRLYSHSHFRHRGGISIHALREEGDRAVYAAAARSCYFYPRPPRGGRRPVQCSL